MRSSKILIPAVLGIVIVAAFYFLALTPKRDEVAQLDTDIAAKQAQIDQSKATLVSYQDAKDRYQRQLPVARPHGQGRAGRRRRPLAAHAAVGSR